MSSKQPGKSKKLYLQCQDDDNICGTVDVNRYQSHTMSVQVILL